MQVLDISGQLVDTSTTNGRLFLIMKGGVADMEWNLNRDQTLLPSYKGESRVTHISRCAPYGFRFEGSRTVHEPSQQAWIRSRDPNPAVGHEQLRTIVLHSHCRTFVPNVHGIKERLAQTAGKVLDLTELALVQIRSRGPNPAVRQ